MTAHDIRSLTRRFQVLLVLRFVPIGLFVTVFVLLMQDRGLSLGDIGLATAAQGVVMLFLELPSGGLADALGRKPVLLLASVVWVAGDGRPAAGALGADAGAGVRRSSACSGRSTAARCRRGSSTRASPPTPTSTSSSGWPARASPSACRSAPAHSSPSGHRAHRRRSPGSIRSSRRWCWRSVLQLVGHRGRSGS